ncbi:MAG TPA: 3-phosphoshikimate 1-carboxyvinyltransferase [archaeon]|nr:3-phosphoshikimate 1-carboxyvinyltransferase [archaeon]
MQEHLTGAKSFSGTLRVPGDKSISHRALMFGAMARGQSAVRGLASGLDVRSTAECLRALGVEIKAAGPETVLIRGAGPKGLREPGSVLDAGNSGTTMRLLSGILAGQPFQTTITGDKYLRQRPMRRIIEPLESMGAQVLSAGGGFPPLSIRGGSLTGINYRLPVASAQVKSCVLLAGLYARGRTTVIETVASRDHTERMLPLFGVEVKREGLAASVEGGAALVAVDLEVPGDPSSAAFFAAAAALVPGGEVRLEGLCLNPTRAAFYDLLEAMGAKLEKENQRTQAGEPVADLIVRHSPLKAAQVDRTVLPSLIDEVPVLAVLATQAEGLTRILDAGELRLKETDRIAAIAGNLTRMGARVREMAEGLEIEGPCTLKASSLDSFGDHRIAMAMSVAALAAEGETVIENSGCAEISFPGFYPTLRKLAGLYQTA